MITPDWKTAAVTTATELLKTKGYFELSEIQAALPCEVSKQRLQAFIRPLAIAKRYTFFHDGIRTSAWVDANKSRGDQIKLIGRAFV